MANSLSINVELFDKAIARLMDSLINIEDIHYVALGKPVVSLAVQTTPDKSSVFISVDAGQVRRRGIGDCSQMVLTGSLYYYWPVNMQTTTVVERSVIKAFLRLHSTFPLAAHVELATNITFRLKSMEPLSLGLFSFSLTYEELSAVKYRVGVHPFELELTLTDTE